jgi:hypothetical protein
MGNGASQSGEVHSSVVAAPAHLFRVAPTTPLHERAITFLRRPNALSRRIKSLLQALWRVEAPAWPVYHALANERMLRHLVLRHLVRALYHQPILRKMCNVAGERLLLDPGTGVPVIYGIDVVLGDGVHLSGRTTFAGALRNEGRRPRLVVGD